MNRNGTWVRRYPSQSLVPSNSGINRPALIRAAHHVARLVMTTVLACELLVRFRPKTAFMGTSRLALAVQRRWAPATEWSQR
jgi:hypothetical protein